MDEKGRLVEAILCYHMYKEELAYFSHTPLLKKTPLTNEYGTCYAFSRKKLNRLSLHELKALREEIISFMQEQEKFTGRGFKY